MLTLYTYYSEALFEIALLKKNVLSFVQNSINPSPLSCTKTEETIRTTILFKPLAYPEGEWVKIPPNVFELKKNDT